MKCVLLLLLFCVSDICRVSANTRDKRQVSAYTFPGPRRQRQTSSADYYDRKPTYEDMINQYEPATRAQTYRPTLSAPEQGYSRQPYQPESYSQPQSQPSQPAQPQYRAQPRAPYPKQGTAGYGDTAIRSQNEIDAAKEEEENKKPDRLALLLQDSKFTCSEKKDGYYADDTVSCQVFHYCVSGAKHSWQCPEGTVFHQVHLNCVPAGQDICKQSAKYYVVNDYLYKPLDQRGPNNTVRYHQRYYPEEYARSDPLLNPNLSPVPSVQHFGGGVPEEYSSNGYSGGSSSSAGRSPQPQSYPSYQSYPQSAPASAPSRTRAPQPQPQLIRAVYRPVARPAAAPAPYEDSSLYSPDYSTLAAASPTQRPSSYSAIPSLSAYGRSDSSADTSYASSGYSPSSGSSYPSSNGGYSPSSSGYGAPSSSSGSSGYSPSSGASSYPSSSSGASYPSSGSSSYTPYRPQPQLQAQAVRPSNYPASYPSSQSYPSVGFRSAAAPSYGSAPQATRLQSSAFASPTRYAYPGTYAASESASGVKYDEDY